MPKRSRFSSDRRSSFFFGSAISPTFFACLRSPSRESAGSHFAAAGISSGTEPPELSRRARAFSFISAALYTNFSSRPESKSTLVIVLKRDWTTKVSTSESCAPPSAALWAYQPIPSSAWISRSCRAAASGSFPQTPCTVQPVPLAVCSH